jgi:hypothetical protein
MDPQHLYKECSFTKTEYKRKEAVKRAGQRLVVLEKSPNDGEKNMIAEEYA